MELNSLLILLEAAEYLERRDREAEHGYASVLPFDGDFAREKTKAAGLVRKAPNNSGILGGPGALAGLWGPAWTRKVAWSWERGPPASLSSRQMLWHTLWCWELCARV
ncbi:MXD4 isoform 2 [Pan troglodytes]|uniref:MXD4 isoform 2 n=1 Tax=Pan troglodytes TaxID=9598 RepID=A0A2J8K6N0_PANTR|nr:MAX dimerization protein 4 [Homo sapiens]KAI4024629.1 MAX dimerization protein 4 [Homo sapiens]PNI30639.1 MXD4 isoform 2 [Pan troglodytes]|eukprot:XP_016863145.1 max dimerization protein 4 isoform X3 [Homo sapiens]